MKNPFLILCVLPLLVMGCDRDQPDGATGTDSQQTVPQAMESPMDSAQQGQQPEADVQPDVTESQPAQSETPVPVEQDQAMTGEQVFKKYCMACHMTGAANAPRVGDTEAWAPRIAKGMDVLLMSAVNGVPNTAMPAAGTCTSCTEGELQAAIEFMIEQSR